MGLSDNLVTACVWGGMFKKRIAVWEAKEAFSLCVKGKWSCYWMCTVDMGTAMSSTNASDPWEKWQSFPMFQLPVLTHDWPVCTKSSNCSFLLLVVSLRIPASNASYQDQLTPLPVLYTINTLGVWIFTVVGSWCHSIRVHTAHLTPDFLSLCLSVCPFFVPSPLKSGFQTRASWDAVALTVTSFWIY